MRIMKLVLKNFGVYRGVNEFEFSNNKPVVLIGGMNGHGKTTFLNAILLGLYGSNSPAYTEGDYRTFGNYLKANTNTSGNEVVGSIELTFEVSTEEGSDEILLKRSWDSSQKRIHDVMEVYKNGLLDDYLTNNWSTYVEGILPHALSEFFFFDGEKIAELATDNSGEGIKKSIKTLLGISVVEQLQKDLGKLGRRVERRTDASSAFESFVKLRESKEELELELSRYSAEIHQHEESIEAVEKALEMLKTDFSSKGGQAIADRTRLQEKRKYLTETLNESTDALRDICAGAAPLAQISSLLNEGYLRIKESHQSAVIKEALPSLEEIAKSMKADNPEKRSAVQEFIRVVEKQSGYNAPGLSPDLSATEIAQLENTLTKDIPTAEQACYEKLNTIEKIRGNLDSIEKSLAVEADEAELEKINIAIEKNNECLISITSEKRHLEAERASINGQYITVAAEYKRSLKSTLSELNCDQNNERLAKYIAAADPILERFAKEMQGRKTELLGTCISNCYRKLARKTSLVDHICVDSESLDLSLFSNDGKNVPRISLSAGEKQLLVVSTLWALALCSKKQLPVIIDTPLARLDCSHRMSLVKTYFPSASDQTIILSTDSEVFGKYYNALKPNISDEFTLVYQDDIRATEVKRGYFIEGAGE